MLFYRHNAMCKLILLVKTVDFYILNLEIHIVNLDFHKKTHKKIIKEADNIIFLIG
jgi:hypothetical protein